MRSWSDANFDYTETSFFAVTRGGTIAFADVPVDGSTKMTDDLLESIEPFDLSEAVDFQTAYLAGYLADKYDVDSEQSIQRANERIKKSAEDALLFSIFSVYTCIMFLPSMHERYGFYATILLLLYYILYREVGK